ncbi:MAG TPA: hypothetical protein VFV80_08470 [Geminicoccaceae bacterium]|nr:hypothetical protein [Geminicoccaceae bacterium]
MDSDRQPSGWSWFEAREEASPDPGETSLCRAFARCFSGPEGQQALAHLRRRILDRRLGPSATDAELWYLEGQRGAIAYVLGMIERGGR